MKGGGAWLFKELRDQLFAKALPGGEFYVLSIGRNNAELEIGVFA